MAFDAFAGVTTPAQAWRAAATGLEMSMDIIKKQVPEPLAFDRGWLAATRTMIDTLNQLADRAEAAK